MLGAGWGEVELEVEAEKGADPEPCAGTLPGAGALTRAGPLAGADALVEAGPLVEVVEAAAPPDGALRNLGVEGGDCEEATRMKTTTMAKSATVPTVKP